MVTKLKRTAWGFAVTACSWAIFNLVTAAIVSDFDKLGSSWWEVSAHIATYSAALMSAVWVVLLLPLSILLPAKSPLWHWYVCPAAGAFVTLAVLYSLGLIKVQYGDTGAIWGGSVGAFTGLLATLTRRLVP